MTAEARILAKDGTGRTFENIARKINAVDRAAKRANAASIRTAAHASKAVERQAARADAAVSGTNAMLLGAASRVAGPAALAFGAYKATESALSFERTMYEVEKATNSSGDAAQAYGQKILDLARATGKTKEELGSLMASAGFAGRPVEELARFTEYAAKATTAWGTSAEETGQGMAILGNIYSANQQRIEEIGDAINTAADVSATREKDLLEFIKRTGATGKLAGFSAEQVLAFGAAMGESGTSMEVAATGFEGLLKVLKLGDQATDKADDGLRKLGVSGAKMQREFKAKPLEATLALLTKISKVPDAIKRDEILFDLFGAEYQDDVSKLINALPRLNSLLGTMGNRMNYIGSVNKSFDLISEKDFNRLDRATQALDVLALRAGNAFRLIAGQAAEEINKLVDATERGDSFFQRYQRFVDAQNEARDPEFKKKEQEDMKRNDEIRQQVLDFVKAPFVWADSKLGPTGNAAAEQGRESVLAEQRAAQDQILLRLRPLEEEVRRLGNIDERKLKFPNDPTLKAVKGGRSDELSYLQEDVRRIHQGRHAAERAAAPLYPYAGDDNEAREPRSNLPATAPLPPPRPVDVTGKVEADVTGTISTTHVVKVEASPELIARVTSMQASSTGPVKASVGTSMPHIKAGPR
jgi:TP901 family phage tail tape measure protein